MGIGKQWPDRRAAELRQRLRALSGKKEILYSFYTGIPPSIYRYFSEGLDEELADWSPEPFRYVPTSNATTRPDVVILTGHGNDLHKRLWEIREQFGADTLILVWLWDNHTGYINNVKTALAADIVFPSHATDVSYLYNPVSAVSTHVPACSAQWTRREAETLFGQLGRSERKSKLLVNYVEYDFAPTRNAVIREIAATLMEADVHLMPSGDRTRYFGGSAADRFKEWAGYKATIILPVSHDLSTRFFDALLAGTIPIIPDAIPDIDRLFRPEVLDSLGVVWLNSYDIDEIRRATHEAIGRFDALGLEGILARHRFALEDHMLINRVTSILYCVFLNAAATLDIDFSDGPFGAALYQKQGTDRTGDSSAVIHAAPADRN